jgi:hypothetical protein
MQPSEAFRKEEVQDARSDWNQFLEEFERQKMSQEEM